MRRQPAETVAGALATPSPRKAPNFAEDYTLVLSFEGIDETPGDTQFLSLTVYSADESVAASVQVTSGTGTAARFQYSVNGSSGGGAVPFWAPGPDTFTLQVSAAGDVILSNTHGILFLGNVGAGTDVAFDHAIISMEDDLTANKLRCTKVSAVRGLLS